jgi:hypothetical protein
MAGKAQGGFVFIKFKRDKTAEKDVLTKWCNNPRIGKTILVFNVSSLKIQNTKWRFFNMITVKPIKSKYMAGWLMYYKGLDLINKEKDRRNPDFDVYLFENTEELHKYMTEYIENYSMKAKMEIDNNNFKIEN